MKSMATLALAVLVCVPAKAQLGGARGGGPPAQNIELELLEMQQEADKAALKEALLLQAREGMKAIQGTEAEKKRSAEDAASLSDFIAKKKEVINARAAEILDKRMPGRRGPAVRPNQPPDEDNMQEAVERYEKAKIEAQLLQ